MRCAAGVHMQASRQRTAIPAKQEYRRLTPSLRMSSEFTKNPVSVGAVSSDVVEPARVVRATIGSRRKRRSFCKDESPRSGLLPNHTLEGNRSRSDYGIVTNVQRLEEQLKLSDYGLLSPIAIPFTLADTSKPPPSIRTSTVKHIDCTKWKRMRSGFSVSLMYSFPHALQVIMDTVPDLMQSPSPPLGQIVQFFVVRERSYRHFETDLP
ncbi:unnamed protein product [Angiostrongylus costaricensis]|uniref:Uncharacterized protein n=1 Tax=Angiostrongylus costaricensis TaxID=334426 RepID=A0A158PEJ3_ANGCS|nr:unnamed protein product [Angiostrongylus costaricensis]